MNGPVKIVFMGSQGFAVPILESLLNHYLVRGVVTQPDRPAGRGGKMTAPAVKVAANRWAIPIIQPERLREAGVMEQLRKWDPDLIIVAAFGQILREEVLTLPTYGCINVHGSLLPRWRGAAPIQAAILAGDKETGVTLLKMDKGIDTGPTLAKRYIPIDPNDTTGSLFPKLAHLGASLLIETLPKYLRGEVSLQPQGEEGATHASMLKKEDGRLDFTQPGEVLERRVRAMNPWPGAFLQWKGTPLKVHRASVHKEKCTEPGNRFSLHGSPAIGTMDGCLVLEEVQPAGKNIMPGKAFLAGAREWNTEPENS